MPAEEQTAKHIASEKAQINTVWEFFGAGVLTTSTSLSVRLNVLVHYPDVQSKLRAEILQVVGSSRAPVMSDRNNMPYTCATIMELGRFASIVPFSVPHKATSTLGGYTIPAGTQVWINAWTLHHDDKLWTEPF